MRSVISTLHIPLSFMVVLQSLTFLKGYSRLCACQCICTHKYTGRGPQILNWSWGLPGMGPGNQTPVWSSPRRAEPLNCHAVSLVNFLSSPFLPPFSVSHPITVLPRLTCSSWAYLTPSLSWSSWNCMQHHAPHVHFTHEQKLRETEGPKVAWLIRGGNEGLNP